jgi:hypothetical protein
MQLQKISALIGGAIGVLAAGAELARAQENTGSTVDLGASIEETVTGAVSSISTNSGGTVVGGTQVERSEVSLGEQQGLAIADASGGNNNISFVS